MSNVYIVAIVVIFVFLYQLIDNTNAIANNVMLTLYHTIIVVVAVGYLAHAVPAALFLYMITVALSSLLSAINAYVIIQSHSRSLLRWRWTVCLLCRWRGGAKYAVKSWWNTYR